VIRQLDWRTAITGALVTLVILEPPVQVIAALKVDDRTGAESYWWVIGALAVLIGFAAGGWLAARRRPSTPFLHGATAAAIAYAAHLIVRTLIKIAGSDRVGLNVANTLLVGQIAISLGILGAYAATRRHARTAG
jgi:hypothetical protein